MKHKLEVETNDDVMKHKLELETNDEVKAKKTKCDISMKDEILLIKQNLKDESSVSIGLEQFVNVISSPEDGVEYIQQYLALSPDCKDLFTPMTASKSSPKNLVLVWNIVEKILTVLLENDETSEKLNFSAHAIVCNILHNHMDLVYFSLYKVPKLHIRSSTLNCLALMLSPGIQTVREFQKCFHFAPCFKQLKECAKVSKKGKHEEDTRSSFVRFYLAFLVFGDVSVIKKLLEEKDFSSLLMADLHLDKIENISVILETIDDKIINEANLLRTSKLSFFTQQGLLKLTFLMKHDDDTIKSQASKMLSSLCTDQRYGLCFPPKDVTHGKLVNPILLKFLISVKQSAITREEILDLTVETLNACPDIIVPYMNSMNMSFDPRVSDMWCSRITFLVKLWEGVHKVDDILVSQKGETTWLKLQNKDFVMKLTIPHQMTRQLFTQGMKNKVNRVKQATLEMLQLSLSRCIDLKNVLQQTVECKSELTQWVDAMMNILPDVTPIIGIRQMAALTTDTSVQNLSNENDKETMVTNQQDDEMEGKLLYDPIEMDILLNVSIKCLNMYQILKSGVLTLSGFNISKLLSFSRPVTSDLIHQSLDILLNETGAFMWVKKKMIGPKNNIFYIVLNVMLSWRQNEEIMTKSKKLFFKILNVMGQFDEYTFEVDSWVTHILSSADTSSIGEFADSCIKTVSEPFTYLENISKLFKDHQSGYEKDDFKLPSPLFFAVLRSSMSSETVIRQNIIPVFKELLITQWSPQLFIRILLQEIPEDRWSDYKEFLVFSHRWLEGLELDASLIPIDQFKETALLTDKENEQELTCINTIVTELLNIKDNDSDEVESILDKISQMKENLNFSCTECPVSSIHALSTFLTNIINFLYTSRELVTSCNKLQHVLQMIESSMEILLTRYNDTKACKSYVHMLFNLPLLDNILNIQDDNWKSFSQNIYILFLKCYDEFKSTETLKSCVDNLVRMVGTDCRSKSNEALQMFCQFSPHLGEELLVDVARSISISLLASEKQECDEYYTNYLHVLTSIKDARVNSDELESRAMKLNGNAMKYLQICICCENRVMMEVFLTIISMFHFDGGTGGMSVNVADYEHLLQLKDKPFVDCALWMSCRNFQLVADEETGTEPIKCNDKFIEDIRDGSISPHHLITNLSPLLIKVFKMNSGSVEHCDFVLKFKSSMWDVIIENFDADDSSAVSLLKLFIQCTTDEEKIEYLNKLKCLLEHNKVKDMEVVLKCCTESFSLLRDGKKVKTCLFDIISVVMDTITRDKTTENIYIICVQYLVNLVLMSKNFETKLKSSHYSLVSESWVKFVKKILKSKYDDNVSMSALLECINVFCVNKRFMKVCSLTATELYNLIVSHSKFLHILFNEEKQINKVILIKMISKLGEVSSTYKPSLVPMLLMTYEASLCEKDQVLLSILHQYEKHNVSLSKFYPFVWGSSAFDVYKNSDLKSSLFKERSSAQVLEHIDKHKMVKSATQFPIHLSFENCCNTKSCPENYNPLFFLPLFVNILQAERVVDCYHFMESGCLSFTFAALSSFDTAIRKLAYCTLTLFNDHLHLARFREKSHVTYLLMLLKNSVSEENSRFPSIWTCFFIQYIHYIVKPDHHLYTVLSNLILHKPMINTKELPVFLSLFTSFHMDHSVERSWLLKLLGDGLKDVTDYYLYKKYHVFELLLAFYDSQVCDESMKLLVHNVFLVACSFTTSTFDLVKTHSILPWIHCNVTTESSKPTEYSFHHLLYTIVNTFRDDSCRDASDEKKEKVLPKLLLNEIALICEQSLRNAGTLNEKDYMDVVLAYSWVQSTANYFGDMNLWLQDIDVNKYFDRTTDLLMKTQSESEDESLMSEVVHNFVLMLLEKDVTSLGGFSWTKLYHLGIERKLKNIIELFDRLIQWCNTTGNMNLLEKIMYIIG